jgi:hypothetical protein
MVSSAVCALSRVPNCSSLPVLLLSLPYLLLSHSSGIILSPTVYTCFTEPTAHGVQDRHSRPTRRLAAPCACTIITCATAATTSIVIMEDRQDCDVFDAEHT